MNKIVTGLGLLAALVAGPRANAQVFSPKTFELANGLQVVVIENHRAPIVTQMVWYKAGAADEVQGKSGIAHFLEHMAFNGSNGIPEGEMVKLLERNGLAFGADTNAQTGFEQTLYILSLPKADPIDFLKL